jgi:hypothetical protein
MTGCKATRCNDQMICGHCGLQWDVGDADRPACAEPKVWVVMRDGKPQASTIDARAAHAWRKNGLEVREVKV